MVKLPSCQLRSKINGVCCGIAVKPGEIFWIDEQRARWLIDDNIAELVVQAQAGPSEQPELVPGQTKEAPEKKSAAAAPAGPSTDSAGSSVPGTAPSSPASPEAPASRPRKPKKSRLGGLFGAADSE